MQERTISLAGKDYVLRYTLRDRLAIEKRLGKGLWTAMQDNELESAATILWGGMRHANKRLMPEDVIDLFQGHQDQGGEYDPAFKVAVRAMFDARIFGKEVQARHIDIILGEENVEGGKAPEPATVKAAE